MFTDISKAKINLTLHVGRAIADPQDRFYGYHPLDSLVVFSHRGDGLSVKPSEELKLDISGAFGSQLKSHTDTLARHVSGLVGVEGNLILKAYRAVGREVDIPPLAFSLVKNLPVAAGIGGGSANAASALRLMMNYADLTQERWQQIALSLGADVPVCWLSQTAHMTGIGDNVQALSGLGQVAAVLVNPGVALSTAKIFNSFDIGDPCEMPRRQKGEGTLIERALFGCNDLERAARAHAPIIAELIENLAAYKGCELARMSGSGATCFALFSTDQLARQCATEMRTKHPEWWVEAVRLGTASS